MIEEILPGILHWTAFHDGIGHTVHSALELSSGTLIDPMEPAEGVEAVARHATPRRIVLTNRLHYRHSARYVERFGCPVLCHEAGTDHFDAEQPVGGFCFDEQLAPGVRDGLTRNLRRICDEDFDALLFAHAEPVRTGARQLLDDFVSRQR